MSSTKRVTSGIIGPFDRHCAGAPLSPDSAYIAAPIVALSSARIQDVSLGPTLLDRIVAFDAAEAAGANVTQTNMVQVSSFCGPNGFLLGYDVLPQPEVPHPLLGLDDRNDLSIFELEPLLAAAKALFGTVREPHFPIRPGQHLLCAYKSIFTEGPCTMYGSLAVAIPEDRSANADLFMEDLGTWPDVDADKQAVLKAQALMRLIDSVRRVSDNLGVNYTRIYAGIRTNRVPKGNIGCALIAAPYIQLAQKAVPQNCAIDSLQRMNVSEWLTTMENLSPQIPK